MPFSFFTFTATTGGVPTANFTFPVGAVPAGALIQFAIAALPGSYADTPTDNAGTTYIPGGLDFQIGEDSPGNAALVINLNNAVAAQYELQGIVLIGLDNILGPLDQEAFVDENLNPASTTHSTADPGPFQGPIVPLFAGTAVVAYYNGVPGSTPSGVFPGQVAIFLGAIREFVICLLYPAPIAPYNGVFDTVASISDCNVSIWDYVVAGAIPPTPSAGLLPLLGVGK